MGGVGAQEQLQRSSTTFYIRFEPSTDKVVVGTLWRAGVHWSFQAYQSCGTHLKTRLRGFPASENVAWQSTRSTGLLSATDQETRHARLTTLPHCHVTHVYEMMRKQPRHGQPRKLELGVCPTKVRDRERQ